MAQKKKTKSEEKTVEQKENQLSMTDIIVQKAKEKYGNQTILTPKDVELMNQRVTKKNVIPSGSISFDGLTGIGGLPAGRIFLAFGPSGIGKTTTCLALYKEASKLGYILVYIDMEHRLDVSLLDSMGIDRYDPNKFVLILPNYGIEAFDMVYSLLQMGKPLFIILDSISSIKVRPSDKAKSYGEGKRMGQVAAMMSEFLKDVTPLISDSNSVLMQISQERIQGLGSGMPFKSSTGGKAPEFYSTLVWQVFKSQGGDIVKNNRIIGHELSWKFKKISTGLPQSNKKIAIKFGYGFYKEYELLRIAEQIGLVKKSGSWYTYNETKGQGFMSLVEVFENDKKLYNDCLLYTSPSPRDLSTSRMPSSA